MMMGAAGPDQSAAGPALGLRARAASIASWKITLGQGRAVIHRMTRSSVPRPMPGWSNMRSSTYANSLGVILMSDNTLAPDLAPAPIPVREVIPWVLFGALLLLALYFVGAEEGATSIVPGMYVHEFVHDGRHLLGFPCH